MGVDQLYSVPAIEAAKEEVSLPRLKGKRLGVDTDFIIRLCLYCLDDTTHYRFLYKAKRLCQTFHQNNIQLVWVFDGRAPPWKESEIEVRQKTRKRNVEKRDEAERDLNDFERLNRLKIDEHNNMIDVQLHVSHNEMDQDPLVSVVFVYQDSASTMNDTMQQLEIKQDKVLQANRFLIDFRKTDKADLKTMLELMNIPVIQSEYETDSVLGALARVGLIDGAITKDSDLLFHGVDVYAMTLSSLEQTQCLTYYSVAKILSNLHLNATQFMEACFLRGTDYKRAGLKGVGIETAFDLMRTHNTIDGVCAHFLNALYTKRSECMQKVADCIRSTMKQTGVLTRKKDYAFNIEHQAKVVQLLAKQDATIEMHMIKAEDIESKCQMYREFAPWYHEIQHKVLESHKVGTYMLSWNHHPCFHFDDQRVEAYIESKLCQ